MRTSHETVPGFTRTKFTLEARGESERRPAMHPRKLSHPPLSRPRPCYHPRDIATRDGEWQGREEAKVPRFPGSFADPFAHSRPTGYEGQPRRRVRSVLADRASGIITLDWSRSLFPSRLNGALQPPEGRDKKGISTERRERRRPRGEADAAVHERGVVPRGRGHPLVSLPMIISR